MVENFSLLLFQSSLWVAAGRLGSFGFSNSSAIVVVKNFKVFGLIYDNFKVIACFQWLKSFIYKTSKGMNSTDV